MRELRTCDFCGADAVGVFEVLPPEFTPATDQQRVALCGHCEETLTDVIAPLLTRLGVDTEVDEQSSSARRAQSGDVAEGTSAGNRTQSDGVDEQSSSAHQAQSEAVDTTPTPPEPADHDSPDEAEDDTDPLEVDSVQADDGEAHDDDVEPEETVADDDTPAEPPQFRKVVRILQNREFPVERGDVEALASNAYDLDDQEVADIFDYAVERGLLVDDDGTLRKP
ncbi:MULTISPECIES: hypothetical protein [Haloferax]|uniref:Uncharacterized protein n=2 Tax=Haloferax TaxID=2251 RepID=A0A6G1YZP9_9EURY|nr:MULTISPECIES: hypothetical protein [Haloferax]KAB1187171.1 hypothetical protein Hfx1149_03635 [Haloferax sp. CBA1149]MRW79809.1 hypothetical protein [Haloferax marinisediminis]